MSPSSEVLPVLIDPVTGDEVVDVLYMIDKRQPGILKQKCLDHGFVNIIDVMPRLVPANLQTCDFALADAARLSYQLGTRKVSSDSGLIDNLIRNRHTSPIEMGEIKVHMRMPIFVMRQHVRHRTASLNEESARYSQLASDFYVPDPEHWAINTSADKQATQQGKFTLEQAKQLHAIVTNNNRTTYAMYEALLYDNETTTEALDVEKFDQGFDTLLDQVAKEIPGLAREQARMILGVNIYTQCYWKIDTKNLLHYISLRWDKHAQYEIRVYGEALKNIAEALFPNTWASFQDHFVDGVNFGKSELGILFLLTTQYDPRDDHPLDDILLAIEKLGWTVRRLEEFIKKVNKSGISYEQRTRNVLQNYKAFMTKKKSNA